MQLKQLNIQSILLILLLCVSNAHAGKFDVAAGYFDFSATTKQKSGSVNAFGSWHIAYRHQILSSFEAKVGYSILMTGIIGGDASYGVDIGFNWFPLTHSQSLTTKTDRVQFDSTQVWRPFIGLSFHQRQFQAVQSSYGGFGGELGVERSINSRLSGRLSARYINLSGPSSATATELDFLTGLTFHF